MDKPTQGQIKEFWKWCGLQTKYEDENQYWFEPKGEFIDAGFWEWCPAIDLNNLFKYGEKPLVDHFIEATSTEEEYRQAYYDFLCKWLADYIWNEPHDPALALFWALWLWQVKEAFNEAN